MESFVDSSDLLRDGEALAARLDTDGYLYVRGLLPRDAVLGVRARFLEAIAAAGWLRAGSAVDEALADPAKACVDPQPAFVEVLRRFYRCPDGHALKLHPNVIGLFERLLGEPVLAHPLLIPRCIFPQRPDFTTPSHQDYPHIQGTTETYSLWLPLGDCPAEMGGIAMARGSHKAGVRDFTVSSGAGGMEVVDPLDGSWVAGPMAAGDVLIFHSLTVHKGLPNASDRLRMSLDNRYQRASEPICERCLVPYAGCGSWDEIYEGWDRPELHVLLARDAAAGRRLRHAVLRAARPHRVRPRRARRPSRDRGADADRAARPERCQARAGERAARRARCGRRPGGRHARLMTIGGLTCCLMPALERATLLDCLRRRRHYATTGGPTGRIILDVAARFDADATVYADDPALGPAAGARARTALMGDIVHLPQGEMTLTVALSAAAPIERVDVFNGRALMTTLRPYGPADLGRRIRVVWEGATYRGRFRQVVWDGRAGVSGDRILAAQPIAFLNRDKLLEREGETGLSWRSATTGNLEGFDIALADGRSGRLALETPLLQVDVALAEIGLEDHVTAAAGELPRLIRICRLPDRSDALHFSGSVAPRLHAQGDNALYVRATLEDGTRAWSSPIYVFRR